MADTWLRCWPLKDTYVQLKTRMDKAVEDFRKAMAATRTGRASVHMLDARHRGLLRLADAAEPDCPGARAGAAADHRAAVRSHVAGARSRRRIRTADLGLNPMNDGKIIRVPVPPLTEERRKDMVKHLHKMLEEHRTAVRNIRRDGNDAIKKATEGQEDRRRRREAGDG